MKLSFETLISVCQYIASTKLRWVKEGEENSVDEVLKVAHEYVSAMQVPEIGLNDVGPFLCPCPAFRYQKLRKRRRLRGRRREGKPSLPLSLTRLLSFPFISDLIDEYI